MRLADGDAISVQGAFKAELYDKDSERRLSLSIVADNALRLPARTPRKAQYRRRECKQFSRVATRPATMLRGAATLPG
jgi:hypothetical protein